MDFQAGYKMIDQICDYYYALQNNQILVKSEVEPNFIKRILPLEPPENPSNWTDIEEEI